MNPGFRSFEAGKDDAGRRLDRVLRKLLPGLPLSRIYSALRKGDVRVSGKKIGPSHIVRENDGILVRESLLEGLDIGPGVRTASRNPAGDAAGEKTYADIRALVLFRNDHIIALNKPRGMLVHDGNDTLEEAVRSIFAETAGQSLSFSPGPLHRLDRNTSGLILFSASITGAHAGTELFREGKIEKFYLAVLDGYIQSSAVWEDNLVRNRETFITEISAEGRNAKTVCFPMMNSRRHTLCLLYIEHGRTHQIRAQAAHAGHPLSGDVKYGGSRIRGGYFLHAYGVRIREPNAVFGFDELSAPLFIEESRRLEELFGEPGGSIPSFHVLLQSFDASN